MPSRTVWSVILAAMIMAFAALSITPASAQVTSSGGMPLPVDQAFTLFRSDLDIKKVGDKVVVSYAYEREIPLFGPAYLTLKYKGETR